MVFQVVPAQSTLGVSELTRFYLGDEVEVLGYVARRFSTAEVDLSVGVEVELRFLFARDS